MKKIYIAGKITGECETPELMKMCFEKFQKYGKNLSFGVFRDSGNCNFQSDRNMISFTHGLYINRFIISQGGGTWQQYMKNDIAVMLTCDEVHFLPDWINSKGAKLEMEIAKTLDMKIIEPSVSDLITYHNLDCRP